MDKAQLQAEIERLSKGAKSGRIYSNYFDYWTLLMAQQYSIFLTGLGKIHFR